MTANITTASYKVSGGTTSRTLGQRGADVINVRDFGAVGDGVTDDTAAFVAAFSAAFGSSASPNIGVLRYNNKPVFIPSGHYIITSPLYLTAVDGGYISGNGSNSTLLDYTGGLVGNTISSSATGGSSAITPLIFCNGFRYSRMEGLSFSMPSSVNTACLWLYSGLSSSGAAGDYNQNGCIFSDLFTQTAGTGILVGYGTRNGLCSENVFINCTAVSNLNYAFRNIDSNALNNVLIDYGAASCGVAVSAPTGQVQLYGGSFANQTVCDVQTGDNPMIMTAVRSESINFVDMAGSANSHTLTCCLHADLGSTTVGYFLNTGDCYVNLDSCTQASSSSRINGSGYVNIRNCDLRNPNIFTAFTGNVGEWTRRPSSVSGLPTPASYLVGVTRTVTDSSVSASNSSNYGAALSGGGANTVTAWCDGSNWRIG